MEEKKQRENGRELYEWVQALVCSVLAVVILFTFVIRLIGVDGRSMVPTLQDGDRLLVLNSMLYDDYKYGDIVVLRKDTFLKDPIVKRVIATEGQTVDIDFAAGSVYVDGVELEEDKIPVSEVTRKICDHFGINYLRLISSGCMMIIVHPDREEAVMEAIRNVGVDVTRIGRVMEQGAPRVLIGKDGVVREIDPPESDELYKVVK